MSSKVTRIAYSKGLNQGKYEKLELLAFRLGNLRNQIWQEYGSLKGINIKDRQIRDKWLSEGRKFNIPARLWKETLRDTVADIKLYYAAAKAIVRKKIAKRTNNEDERKVLYTLLKQDKWQEDSYLRRTMRKHFKHGQTSVVNQIILDSDCYTAFEHKSKTCLKVMSLEKGKRIVIPLSTNHLPKGTLRLILKGNGVIEVHHTIDQEVSESCGQGKIGIDKGYTEVFIDSDGQVHGDGLGQILSSESNYLKHKYQKRNKLKAIGEAKPHKLKKIQENNLSRMKLDARKSKHESNVRTKIFEAVHSVVNKADTIVCEDLTSPIKSKSFGKNQNRRLSAWVKGKIADALTSVSHRRGSSVKLVNCSYTSQVDSRHGVLLGHRKGEKFYCYDGEVLNADTNAAKNVLNRLDDNEIQLYTPYTKVRSVLLKRTEQFNKRLVLLNQDSSCKDLSLSTESELPLSKDV